MNVDKMFTAIAQALSKLGWKTSIEDNLPDLKQLVCHRGDGILHAITRLDVLLMIPGNTPATAPGITIFFVFLSDPDRVEDMRAMGKLLRKDNFLALRQECDTILHCIGITAQGPHVSIATRPRSTRTKFSMERINVPAFLVEISYWIPTKFEMPDIK